MDIDILDLYKLKIDSIDIEHRNYVILLKALYDAVKEQQDTIEHEDAFEAALIAHFVNEEALMLEISYPHRAAHVKAHQELLRKVHEMLNTSDKHYQKHFLIDELFRALLDHIDWMDFQYVPYYDKK